MAPDRKKKKPGLAFWVTVVVVGLVVVVVMYVASVGPAASIIKNLTGTGGRFHHVCEVFYAPLKFLYPKFPQALRDALNWYAHLRGG